MVFDGSARQSETAAGGDFLDGARLRRAGVLDGVGFIEDDLVEVSLAERLDISKERAIGDHGDIDRRQ